MVVWLGLVVCFFFVLLFCFVMLFGCVGCFGGVDCVGVLVVLDVDQAERCAQVVVVDWIIFDI